MKYSIYIVIKKIWDKKAIYITIAALLAIGVNLFCQSFNKYFAERNYFNTLVKDLTEVSATVDANYISTDTPEREAITYEDYIHFKNLYSENADFVYSFNGRLSFLLFEDGKKETELITFNVIFMDTKEMERILNVETGNGQYYAGDEVLKYISLLNNNVRQDKGERFLPCSYLALENDIELAEAAFKIDGQIYKLMEIPKSIQSKKINTGFSSQIVEGGGIEVKDCVFIPLEGIVMRDKLFPQGSQAIQSRLIIQEKELGNDVAFEIINYLSNKNQDVYIYNIGNEYLTAKMQLDYVTSRVKSYMIISCLQILLISLCSSGIFLIIFSKRKKSIAISIMLGSTLMRQIMEILLEVSVVVLMGILVGFMAFYIFKGSTLIQLKTLFILALASMGIIAISVSLTLKDVKCINPLEVLQKN